MKPSTDKRKRPLYLGIDVSTQSMTALLMNPFTQETRIHSVGFDAGYPAYGTIGGVRIGADSSIVHADPLMWVEALDDMLAWVHDTKLAGKIRGIGISAQQHGTVYLKSDAYHSIAGMKAGRSMEKQLKSIFSRGTSPVWMDTSTTQECKEITDALGGDEAAAALTVSVATERFAAPQIRKFWKQAPEAYRDTAHITLISAFLTSLLIGEEAPVDAGDGYGTNLAAIHTGTWDRNALMATAPDLKKRMPRLCTADRIVGKASAYLMERHGFSADTGVVIGSGDNPCSLAGLGLIGSPEIHAISFGTSDTYFGYLPELTPQRGESGHIFGAADGRYMFLICFQNGSLARERIKNDHDLDWTRFSDFLMKIPPGNSGRIMLPYFFPEITPKIQSPRVYRFGGLDPSDPAGNIRGVAEAQAMAMFLHSNWIDTRPKEILVTAGGSGNEGLLQVFADVFDANIRTFAIQDSAALGAAFRATRCCSKDDPDPIGFEALFHTFLSTSEGMRFFPSPNSREIYHGDGGMLDTYRACEKYALGLESDPAPAIEAFQKRLFLIFSNG